MLISVYGFLMGTVIDGVGVKWSVTAGMMVLFLARYNIIRRELHCSITGTVLAVCDENKVFSSDVSSSSVTRYFCILFRAHSHKL